ncbi:MAG: HEAT repeat domain-containing protein, partial [Terriglobia bacterium]
LWVCWVLATGILLLVGMIVAQRALRRRQQGRQERWGAELQEKLSGWIARGHPPREWFQNSHRRWQLVEALAERIEQEGRECTRSGWCEMVGPEAALPCGPEGESCRGPAFFRELVDRWGLVDRQAELIARRSGLERARAVLLLGRLRQPRTIPLLARLLDDPSADVRLAAVRALGLIATPAAAEPLLALLHRQEDICISIPSLQRALMSCCGNHPECLLPHVFSLSGKRQALLMRVVAEVATPDLRPALERLATAADPQTRSEVARAWGGLPSSERVPLLLRLATDPVWFVRVRAYRALGEGEGWETVNLLLQGVDSDHPDVRQAAAETLARQPVPLDELISVARARLSPSGWRLLLGELGRTGLFWVLSQQLSSPSEPVRQLAEQWLRAALEAGAHKTVLDTLAHPNPAVVEAVADFLARWGDQRVQAALEEMIAQSRPGSRHHRVLLQVREKMALRACS